MTKILVTVTGIKEVQKFIDKLGTKLESNIRTGMKQYVSDHLVSRIKARLENATSSQIDTVGPNGLIKASGGYGVPHNDPNYAQWKSTRMNLPMVGQVKTRELVATGQLLDKIKVTKLIDSIDGFQAEVGPEDVNRPKVFPMRDIVGNPQYAYTAVTISNLKLNELIEDSDYAFWAKEFNDCEKEVIPYLTYLIEIVIKELASEMGYEV